MEGRSVSSSYWMNIRGSAYLSLSLASSVHRMSSTGYIVYLSIAVCRNTSGLTEGPEFTAKAVREWLGEIGVRTLFIEPGSPWENGYVESFIGKLRDELLNGEIFDTLLEARVVIESWRREYNQCRPHSSLGYRSPAPEAFKVEKFTLRVVHWRGRVNE